LGEPGNVLVAAGKVTEGLTYHVEQLRLAESLSQPREIAGALLNLAASLICAGRNPEALSYFDRAVDLFRVAGNATAEVDANQRLARSFELIGDLRRAAERITIALRVAREHRVPGTRALRKRSIELLNRFGRDLDFAKSPKLRAENG
jgi:tetratricopeptide (TPR) repeat protein